MAAMFSGNTAGLSKKTMIIASCHSEHSEESKRDIKNLKIYRISKLL